MVATQSSCPQRHVQECSSVFVDLLTVERIMYIVELGGYSRLNKEHHMLSNCLLVPPADCVTHRLVHRHATHL